jgi:hypothetical protein
MFETIASVLNWLTSPTQFTLFGFLILGAICLLEFGDAYRTPRRLGRVKRFIQLLTTAQKQLDSNLDREDFLLEESSNDIRSFWSYLEGRRTDRGFLAKYDLSKFILLQYPSELAGTIPTSPFKFVPGIFISLGVFGTFWGITIGLQGLDIGGSSEELFAASASLLSGMRTAFYTSLVGMTCSIVLTVWQGLLQNWRRSQYDNLRKRLDRVAFMESAERLLAKQDTSGLGEASEALKFAAEQLKTLSAEAIGQEVGKSMKPTFDEIREELSELRSAIGKDRQELIEALVKEQEERLIKPVVQQLDESAKLTREASEAVLSLKDSLGDITRELGEAVKTIQEFQKETLVQLKEFSDGLAKTLSDFTTEQKTVIQDMTDQLKTSIIETTEAQTQLIRSVGEEAANTMRIASQELQTTLGDLTQRLGSFTEDLGQVLYDFNAKLREEFSRLLEQMVDTITDTTQQQTALIQQTGEQAANTITTASNESAANIKRIAEESSGMLAYAAQQLRDTLTAIDEELTKIRITVQEELEKFRDEYMKSLEKFFEDNDKKLETILLEYTARMEASVTRIDEIFQQDYEQRVKIHRALLKEVQTVTEFAEQVGLTSADRLAQLDSVVRNLGTEAKQIQDRYENFIGVLNDGLKTNNDHLKQSLELIYDRETKFFDTADATVETLAKRLTQAASALTVVGVNGQIESSPSEAD